MENQPTNPPDNNLVWAILCTVLCCLPLGIVAILYVLFFVLLGVGGVFAGGY